MPWRVLTAELFDAQPDQELLDSIEHVVARILAIGRRRRERRAAALRRLAGQPPRAGSRAPRSKRRPGTWRFWLVDGVRPVEVRIVAQRPPARARTCRPRPACARSPSTPPKATAARPTLVERCGAGDEARTVKSDGTRLEGRAHLPRPDEVELLQHELGGFTTDRIYVESLECRAGPIPGLASMTDDSEALKRAAARQALDLVEDGMRLGLGSGSTAELFLELLGRTRHRMAFESPACPPRSGWPGWPGDWASRWSEGTTTSPRLDLDGGRRRRDRAAQPGTHQGAGRRRCCARSWSRRQPTDCASLRMAPSWSARWASSRRCRSLCCRSAGARPPSGSPASARSQSCAGPAAGPGHRRRPLHPRLPLVAHRRPGRARRRAQAHARRGRARYVSGDGLAGARRLSWTGSTAIRRHGRR